MSGGRNVAIERLGLWGRGRRRRPGRRRAARGHRRVRPPGFDAEADERQGIVSFRIADERGRAAYKHVCRGCGREPVGRKWRPFWAARHGLSMRMLDRIGGWPTMSSSSRMRRPIWPGGRWMTRWRVVYEPSLLLRHPWTLTWLPARGLLPDDGPQPGVAGQATPARSPGPRPSRRVWALLTVVRTRSWDGCRAWAGGALPRSVRESGGPRPADAVGDRGTDDALGRPPVI